MMKEKNDDYKNGCDIQNKDTIFFFEPTFLLVRLDFPRFSLEKCSLHIQKVSCVTNVSDEFYESHHLPFLFGIYTLFYAVIQYHETHELS